MGQQGAESIIHRKAQVARDEFDAREMSPAKALRLSLAKSADALLDMALVVRTVELVSVPLGGMEEMAGDDGLLILLDGADGTPGAVKLDLQFVMALIEMQLMGAVRPGEAAARPFTPTDAAIAQPLMDAVLAGFADIMNASADMTPVDVFRFGDRVDDGRTLGLALSAPDYDLYRMTVDFGPGAKTGVLHMFLPQRPPCAASDETDAQELSSKLEENAMNAPVMLDAVLGRLRLPLSDICDWAPGHQLALSPDTLGKARLLGAQGHLVAQVKLGQLNGFRAVRLCQQNAGGAVDPPKEHGARRDSSEAALNLEAVLEHAVPQVDLGTTEDGLGEDGLPLGWDAVEGDTIDGAPLTGSPALLSPADTSATDGESAFDPAAMALTNPGPTG